MAGILTKKKLEDADIDVGHAGDAVNTKKVIHPRYGEPFKSIPLIVKEGEEEIINLQNAINIAAAAGAGENGWTASLVVDGNENQHDINNKTPRFFKSMNELLLSKPKKNGQLVTLFAYHDGGQRGGSDLIAIQSSILIENGVTVFRSKVVGHEDYFWVRVNISHTTPEMAGAIGDKVYNCRDAFQKCFNVGGDFRPNENSKYLVYGHDITTHRDTYILKCTKPTSITCAGKASVYFKHDVVTGSPRSIIFEGVGENLASLKMEGVDWYGHETEGHANKVNRAWGIGLFGVDNYSIKRCKFSTFQGHCPDITRRKFRNNGDWIQSSDLNQANTSEAINRLMSLSSKNGTIKNIKIRHAGSTGLAFFGADQVSVDGVDADMTGAAYEHSVWTDDASSGTSLKDYALNRGISIKNVKGGNIDLAGCTTATVTGCNVSKITVRAYDFDQQKNNFDSGTHPYNINDHLSAPFLWMQNGGFERRISIYSNSVNKLDIRSIFVDAYKNYFYSQSEGHKFVTCDKNGILWGDGSSYFDDYTSFSAGVKSNVTENTFILNHTNCVCVTYGTASANSYINVTESIIEKTNPAFVYTHMRNANQLYRRDSYYETGANDGHTLSKTINHHTEIKQGLLTQGVGTNHLKTFVNIFGSASGGQTVANFTNTTTPVYFFVNLIDISGRLFRKKIIVAANNTIAVSDLDSQTPYNASFSVTVTSGVIELKVAPAGNDLCLDIIGIGTRGNCVFLVPKERATSVG